LENIFGGNMKLGILLTLFLISGAFATECKFTKPDGTLTNSGIIFSSAQEPIYANSNSGSTVTQMVYSALAQLSLKCRDMLDGSTRYCKKIEAKAKKTCEDLSTDTQQCHYSSSPACPGGGGCMNTISCYHKDVDPNNSHQSICKKCSMNTFGTWNCNDVIDCGSLYEYPSDWATYDPLDDGQVRCYDQIAPFRVTGNCSKEVSDG
jgi:hypothetical protein